MPVPRYTALGDLRPWEEVIGEVRVQLRPYKEHLHAVCQATFEREVVLGWREPTTLEAAALEQRVRASQLLGLLANFDGGRWIILRPARWYARDYERDVSTFMRAREVYEHPEFGARRHIRCLASDGEYGALLLQRLPNVLSDPTGQEADARLLWLRPDLNGVVRQRRALAALENRPCPEHAPLLRLLTSNVRWPPVEPRCLDADAWVFLRTRGGQARARPGTSEQRRFVELALSTPDFAILEGPPGSGKTTTICELIVQLARRGQRILLVAPTHVAVDNVLERLIEWQAGVESSARPLSPIRVGDPERVTSEIVLDHCLARRRSRLVRHFDAPLDECGDESVPLAARLVHESANLVCGTTLGVVSYPGLQPSANPELDAPVFDVLIIDEASKATFTEFLVPAIHARRWIVVGDDRQLAPFFDLESAIDELRKTTADLDLGDRTEQVLAEFRRGRQLPRPPEERLLDWAHEYCWRLARYHELEHNRGERRPLEDELTALMPEIDNEHARRSLIRCIDRIGRVGFTSIFALLLRGYGPLPRVDTTTAATHGLPLASLIERRVRLSYQHRMHPDISQFPRGKFYSNRGDGLELLRDPNDIGEARAWTYDRYRRRVLWLDTPRSSRERGHRNLGEASCVVRELRAFIDWAASGGSRAWHVAVLTFYREQELELRRQLSELFGYPGHAREFVHPREEPIVYVDLCTVDRFQGHEADLVLLSFVKGGRDSVGFLNNPNRLNVALTRARYQVVLIGDRSFFARSDSSLLSSLAQTVDG